jgi:predicted nuclease of predicted toxin-antitoxin system
VKLLLDEHVSPRAAEALRANGYDVEAVSEMPHMRGRSDEDVISYAASQKRAVVTHNFADFLALVSDWAASGREHWGIVLVPTGFQRRGVGA